MDRLLNVMTGLSGWLGVPYPPLALLLIVGCVFVLIFYRFSVIISRLKDDNIALAQRVAILEYHIQSLKDQAAGC